jgi:hypothetical protein
MTSHTARWPAVAASLAVLVVACGGSTPTPSPAATVVPITQAPATQPVGSDTGIPTFALPSFHGDVALESMIPAELGGEAISTQSMSGTEFVGAPKAEFTKVLGTLGKQLSDLSVAFGSNAKVSVTAFQIDGASGDAILDAFKDETTNGGTLTDVSFGGKSVKKVTPMDASDGLSYIYTTQDVVFVVSGAALTDALLTEAFLKLP